jgi:DNA-binding NarL/FixJ family response regulator
MKESIRVFLVDDHEIIRDGIKSLIGSYDPIAVVGEAGSGIEAIDKLKLVEADVVLMDIQMPVLNGMETAEQLLKDSPNLKIIALSMHNEEAYILKMLQIGSMGYLLKESGRDELIRGIETVNGGEQYLSNMVSMKLINSLIEKSIVPFTANNSDAAAPAKMFTKREFEVLKLLTIGATSQQISDQLSISRRTVDTHRRNLFQKARVKNSAGLVNFAFENGLVKQNEL